MPASAHRPGAGPRPGRGSADLVGCLRGARAGASSSTPATVLTQMRDLGLAATEFGPDGFLRVDPAAKADQLASYGLRAVGGFLPVLLHDPGHDPLPEVDRFIDGCLATGAGVRRAGRLHRRRRVRRAARPRRGRLGDPAGQPRPDHRPRRRTRRGRRPPPPRRHHGRDRRRDRARPRRLPRRALHRHRPPARRRGRPGRDHRRPPPPRRPRAPQGRRRRARQRGCGRARRRSATPCATGCSVRSATATSTSRRWCARSRRRATPAGTSSSRT